MHNGGIADFGKIKRKLQRSLSDAAFNMVQGNTGN
jgi:glutamine amidotransferase